MSKMMSRALAIAGMATLAWSVAPAPAGAAVGSSGLAKALGDSDVLVVAQQQKKKKGKRSNPKISPEHQQQIRQHVPAEYHRYIPGMSSGGGGAPAR